MLTLLAASSLSTCLIAIGPSAPGYTRQQVLEHEYGHCNCPNWHHAWNDRSSIVPPKQCRGKPKLKVIIIPYSGSDIHKICSNGHGLPGSDACVVDIW
jgi:hypothetical protein